MMARFRAGKFLVSCAPPDMVPFGSRRQFQVQQSQRSLKTDELWDMLAGRSLRMASSSTTGHFHWLSQRRPTPIRCHRAAGASLEI